MWVSRQFDVKTQILVEVAVYALMSEILERLFSLLFLTQMKFPNPSDLKKIIYNMKT